MHGLISKALSYGGSPSTPTKPSLSIEGIKSLQTLATVTVGNFVFNLKMPSTLSVAGATYYVEKNGNKILYNSNFATYTINDVIASINLTTSVGANYYLWAVDSEPDIPYKAEEWTDFLIKEVNASDLKSSDQLINSLYVNYEATKINKINGVPNSSYSTRFNNVNLPSGCLISNLSPKEHCDFIADCLKAIAVNEPVINIL